MTTEINEIIELFRDFVIARDYQNTPVISAYVKDQVVSVLPMDFKLSEHEIALDD